MYLHKFRNKILDIVDGAFDDLDTLYRQIYKEIKNEKGNPSSNEYLDDLENLEQNLSSCLSYLAKTGKNFAQLKFPSDDLHKKYNFNEKRINERRANYTLELDFDINKWKIKEFVRNFEFFNELNFDGINDLGNVNVLKISANDIEVLEEFIVYYLGGKGYDKQEYEFLRKTIKSW